MSVINKGPSENILLVQFKNTGKKTSEEYEFTAPYHLIGILEIF